MAVAMNGFAEQPSVNNEAKRLWVTKLTLRCIAIVLCLIVIGGSTAVQYVIVLPLSAASGALVWSIAEGITLIVRRRTYKGIHPGACVGVDLILWLALGVMSGWMAPIISDYYYYEYYSSLSTVAIVVGLITAAFHIALFIIACIETHRRRKAKVPLAPAPFYPNYQPGTFNPNQQPGTFNPNQQPGTYNPNQPHAPFNPNQQPGPFNPHQQPGAFIPNQHPTTFIPNPRPTTFPPTSPFPAHSGMTYYPPPPGAGWPHTHSQTQTQTPSPQPGVAQPQPFGQATVAPSQPPQWLGNSVTPGVQHEMSSSPAPNAAGTAGGFNGGASQTRFNGGPPHALGGFSGAPPQAGRFTGSPPPQHELSGGTPAPAPAQFSGAAAPPSQSGMSQAGSPPPRYEMYVRTIGAGGGGGGCESA